MHTPFAIQHPVVGGFRCLPAYLPCVLLVGNSCRSHHRSFYTPFAYYLHIRSPRCLMEICSSDC